MEKLPGACRDIWGWGGVTLDVTCPHKASHPHTRVEVYVTLGLWVSSKVAFGTRGWEACNELTGLKPEVGYPPKNSCRKLGFEM